MKNKIKSILVVSFLVLAGFVMIWNFGTEDVNVQGAVRYVGDDSTYKTIQEAVDNATPGDTIYVKNDTYYESVTISTANIELIGNSTTDCKIIHYYNGSSTSDYAAGINITSDYVNITGFNISVTGNYTYGIFLKSNTDNLNIINNNITTTGNYGFGIHLYSSSNNNNINDNTIHTSGNNRGYGIHLDSSCKYNKIINNTIYTTGFVGAGIKITQSSDNYDIIGNTINTSGSFGYGISIQTASNNILTDNTINTSENYGSGIYVFMSQNNTLIDNTINTLGDDACGIMLDQWSEDNNLINNTINTSGNNAFGIYLRRSGYSDVLVNIINTTGSGGDGIYLFETSYSNLIDNTINTSGDSGYGFYLLTSSNNNLTGNTINTFNNSGLGIYMQLSSNNNNLTGNTINTLGQDGRGIYLQESSNNNNITNNTINTSEQYGYGIYLFLSSNNNNLTANTINTSEDSGYGIYLFQSSNNNVTYNTINTSGQYGYGIYLAESSNNNITDNTINTSGFYGNGIYVFQSSNNNDVIDNTINTSEQYAYGICLQQSSNNNNITDNTINTSEQYANGIYLSQSLNNNLIDNKINTRELLGYGIHLQTSSYNNLTTNTINTSGLNGYGIVIESSTNNNFTGNTINTSGNLGYGIYQVSDSNYNDLIDNTINTNRTNGKGIYLFGNCNNNNLIDNTINTTGDDGVGIYLQISSSDNNLTGNTINTSGDGSYGIYLFQSASGNNLTDNTINTFGVDGYGIHISLDSHYNNLTNNVIVTTNSSGHGIYISNSNNTSMVDCQVSADGTSARGIYLIGMVATIIDSDIDSSAFMDMYVITDGNLTAINCTFTDVDVQSSGGGVLQVKYYLSVQAYYEGGVTPIQNADVVVEDNGVSIYNTSGYGGTDPQTSPNGRIDNILIMDRIYIYSNTALENITTVKVKKTVDASWEETRDVDMSTTHTETFTAADIFKPMMPINLSATSVASGDAINISWNVSLDDTVKYELWWLDPVFGWVIIANITHPTNWIIWQNDSLVNGTKYDFKLRAWDDVDIGSDYAVVNVTHLDFIAPEAPTNLTAETLSDTTIQLTWNLSGDIDLASSWVYMNVTGSGILGPYYRIAVVNLPTSTYIATGLVENETYYFLVKSVDEAPNLSSGSNIAQNTTLNIAPSAPTLDSLPALTNNPKLNVTGTTEPKIDVEIYNNGALTGSDAANVTGAFRIELTLVEGQNAITARAIDKANNPSVFTSPAIDVTLDTVAPVVSLDEFAVDYTKNSFLDVTGSTENDSTVYIYSNDNLVEIGNANSTGQFDIQITLVENENIIHANALDLANNNGTNSTAQSIILDLEDPVANAGTNLNITVGDTANFDGSDSTDNWGIANYTWSFEVNATPIKLYDETASYQFNNVGTYDVSLTIIDVVGNSDTDIMTVEVNPAVLPDLEPPVAAAGPDQTVEEGTEVTLDGSGSTDNDAIKNYTWTFAYEGPLMTLFDETTTFVFAKVGNYNVTLTVIDFAAPPNIGTDNLWVNVTAIVEDDTDGDGYPDDVDAFPNDPNEWEDTDGDNTGDNADTDDDDDGYLDEWEVFLGTEPKDPSSVPPDYDDDGAPDGDAANSMPWMDTDDDDDGYTDADEIEAGTDPLDASDHPTKKEKEDDDFTMYIILIIIIVIIIVVLAIALSRRKPTEEELLAAEEEELEAEEELGMDLEDEEGIEKKDEEEGEEESEDEEEDTFECPTCGATLKMDDTVCPECGEEFEEED